MNAITAAATTTTVKVKDGGELVASKSWAGPLSPEDALKWARQHGGEKITRRTSSGGGQLEYNGHRLAGRVTRIVYTVR